MPDGVPTGVTNPFSALIPASIVITTAATILSDLLNNCLRSTIEVIYNLIQTPMQGLTDSLFGARCLCVSLYHSYGCLGCTLNCSWWHHEWLGYRRMLWKTKPF